MYHTFGWRDFFDVAVRWRQVSEPNDPVWWIDRFPAKAFKEGFGLQTPIVNGQLKTIRYYSYFSMAFDKMKTLLQKGYYSARNQLKEISAQCTVLEKAKTLNDIYALTGEDFYVIIPCPSVNATYTPSSGESMASSVMEGTRLTLVAHEPDGFEFTIRMPGTPARWNQFEVELSSSLRRLEDSLLADCDDTNLLRQALEVFYLWVVFAPLSRGTAFCGYAGLQAILISRGKHISSALPPDKQLDWEAIFAVDCKAFIDKVAPWFALQDFEVDIDVAVETDDKSHSGGQKSVDQEGTVVGDDSGIVDSDGTSCSVDEKSIWGALETLRDMMEILAMPSKS